MADEVQGMIFQIDVDAGRAKRDLKSFGDTAERAARGADKTAKKASESYGTFERKIAGVAGAQRRGAVAAGKGAAAQTAVTTASTTGASAAGRQAAAETAKAGAQNVAAGAASRETTADTLNTAAKTRSVSVTQAASVSNLLLSASIDKVTRSAVGGAGATAAVNTLNTALVGTGAAAGTAAVGLSTLIPLLLPLVAAGIAFFVLAKAVGFLSGEFREAIGAAGSYEAEVTRLAIALNNIGENTDESRQSLLDYAEALQRVSVATEEQIIGALGMAVSLGATTETAKDLALAATNLAAATGVELDTAIRQLGATLGGLSGELGERIPEVKDLTEAHRRMGGAIDVVNQKFADFGRRMATSYAGAINNVGSAFVKLQQNIGETGKEITKVFLQEVLTPFIDRTADAAASADVLSKFMMDMAITVNQVALSFSFLAPAIKKALGQALPQLRDFIVVTGAVLKGLQLAGQTGEGLARALPEDALTPFQKGLLASIDRLKEMRETGIKATDDLGEGFDRLNDATKLGFGFQALLDNVAKLEDARTQFDLFVDALNSGEIALQGIGGEAGKQLLIAEGMEKLTEIGKRFVEAGIGKSFVEMALGINLAAETKSELVGLAAEILTIDDQAANLSQSIIFLENAFASGLVTQEAYREAMAAFAEGVVELAAIGTGLFPELIEQWGWTTVVEARLESLSSKMQFFRADYITAGFAVLGFSQQWSQAMGKTFEAVDRAANALQSIIGKESKFVKALRKVQAAQMVVAGIASIKEGAIKVARGIWPPKPLQILSGLAMIAEGAAAINAARQLGASGGASAGTSVGGGGGGGAAVVPAAPGSAPSEAPSGFQQDITVFIDGQGFIQDPEEFARQIADQIAQQGARSGRTFEN